jgi:hypothetical protein
VRLAGGPVLTAMVSLRGCWDTHDRRTGCSLARQHAQTRREAPDAMHHTSQIADISS